ncbi:MAG: DUF4836 family protein [Bacteroidetes bacterium]|nr:MAG: DUF4836 family protein [Bacteroidota bacterium]
MMTLRNLLSLCLLVGLFQITTAQNKLTDYIPKDASFVVKLDLNNLSSKVTMNDLKKYDFYSMGMMMLSGMMGDEGPVFMNVLEDPTTVGLDLMSPVYLFGKMEDEKNVKIGLAFHLSDETTLPDLLKSSEPEKFAGADQIGGFRHISLDDDLHFAWKNRFAIFSGGTFEQDVNWEDPEAVEEYLRMKSEKSRNWTESLLNLSADHAISSLNRFRLAEAKPADLALWFDYSLYSKTFQKAFSEEFDHTNTGGFDPQMLISFLKVFYNDSYLFARLNFDKGRIAIQTDNFANPGMLAVYKQSLNGDFNKKIARYIRGEELLGYMSFSMNTKGMVDAYKTLIYNELNKMPAYGELVTGALDILGIFFKEEAIAGLFEGDAVVAMTGMQHVKQTVTEYEYDEDFNATEVQREVEKDIPEFSVIWTHQSKNDWMKFVRLGMKSGLLQSAGNYYALQPPGGQKMELFVALKDDLLIMTNSQDLAKKRLKKGYKRKSRIAKSHCENMSQNAFTLFWDIPNTISVVARESKVSGMDDFANMGKQSFESLTMKTSRNVGASVSSELSLNFAEKNRNGLLQVLDLVNEIFLQAFGGSKS